MIAAVAQVVGAGWIGGIQQMAEMYRKPDPPSEWAPPAEWLELPRRTAGDPIPVVFGTVWIDEPHVFWVSDVRAQVLSVTSGEGNLEVGFNIRAGKRRFTAGMGMVLCQGPLDSVARIDIADQVLDGTLSPVVDGALFDLSSGAEEIGVWQPHIHGANAESIDSRFDDGVAGRLGVAPGLTDQAGLLLPKWGTSRGNLRGVTHAWMRGPGTTLDWSSWDEWPSPQILSYVDGGAYEDPFAFYFGAQPTLRPWRFLSTRCLGRAGGESQWYSAKATVDTYVDLAGSRAYDMNPAHVLVELLCDPTWGLDLGDPSDVIDSTSFEAMADAWASGVSIGISWLWDRETSLQDIVRQIERIGDVVLEHEASDDRWHLRSWTSSVTAVEIGDDDIVDIEIDVTAPDELPTTIHVTWQDRRRDREQTYVLQDLAALHERGREIVHWWSVPMIASPVTVPQLARRELSRLTTPRLRVRVVVPREVGASLRKTDPVSLVSTEHGLDGDFRVVEWNHGVRTDGTVELLLIQEPDADSSEEIWHEPQDPTEDTPESLPALSFHLEEMPLHVWWATENGANLPDLLWVGDTADQLTRMWMWTPRPTDRWDLTGWRWADRRLDDSETAEGYVTVSPDESSFTPTFEVTTLDRGSTRYGEDTIEHDGTRVLRVGDILAIPHTDESPITSLDSSGLLLESSSPGTNPELNRGGLPSYRLDYSQMDGAHEFAIVTEVVDSTHVKILGGLWDTLPAESIGGTSYVIGYYPAIDPWDCAPDELRISGVGQIHRAPPSIGGPPLAIRDGLQATALSVAGARLQSFDDITPVEVPLSQADSPVGTEQEALCRPLRPLVGANFNLFDVYTGDGYVAITMDPRTRDSRFWAPSSLPLADITDTTQAECCVWPDTLSGDPPLVLWVIDPASGNVIGTRKWDASGALVWTHPDEKDAHNAIYATSVLFDELIFIVTAQGTLIESVPSPLKTLHSWQYIRFDLDRT